MHPDEEDIPTLVVPSKERSKAPGEPPVMALCLAWSAQEPERVGEIALLPERPSRTYCLGRAPVDQPDTPALRFFRQRPAGVPGSQRPGDAPPRLRGEAISRQQLLIRSEPGRLLVENVGRCPLLFQGQEVQRASLCPGDTIVLYQQLVLLCMQRPLALPPLTAYPVERVRGFGEPDEDGMVGESPAIWRLRELLGQSARNNLHVLILGGSGSGKELAAQAIHNMSPRAARPLISENVSTLPVELAAAILFGNRKNFPQVGMEEREGLVGLADHSTLFLDEIGDMPERVQPMFLRVTEESGSYHRLGEEKVSRSSRMRLIGATNHPERLRPELRRRFVREVLVPGLDQRREDVPLLIPYMLKKLAANRDDAARLLVESGEWLGPEVIEDLLHHRYTTHVSELAKLLGKLAHGEALGDVLPGPPRSSPEPWSQVPTAPSLPPPAFVEPFPQPRSPLRAAAAGTDPTSGAPELPGHRPPPHPPGQAASTSSTEHHAATEATRLAAPPSTVPLPSPEEAQLALYQNHGSVTEAARSLGISRMQLNRLIKKHNLRVIRERGSHYAAARDEAWSVSDASDDDSAPVLDLLPRPPALP